MATQIPLYKFHADTTGQTVMSRVGGIWRPVEDWKTQGIDINSLPVTSDATFRGTSGGGMSYQALLNQQMYDEQVAAGKPVGGTAPLPNTVPASPTPAPTSPTAQPTAIPTGTPDPNQYYKVNTGNIGPDGKPVFDIYNKGTGQKLTYEQGLPLFQSGLNVDHIPLEAGNGTKAVQPPTQPPTTPTTTTPTATTAPKTTTPTTTQTPTTQPTAVPTADPNQYYKVKTATGYDVFDKATNHQYTSDELMNPQKTGFIVNVDHVPLEPVAKTNQQLQGYGVTQTQSDFNVNPLQAFLETYKQIWNSLGLTGLKESYQKLSDEKSEKVATVNDNPWISEAERSRQITKLDAKYDDKLKTTLALFESGQKEAQFVTTGALEAYYKEKTFDQQTLMKQMDLAEKLADVGRNVREVDGGLFDLKTNTWIVPRKKTSGTAEFTPTQQNSGATNAGLSVSDFGSLPADVKNFFINDTKNADAFNARVNAVALGDMTKEEAIKDINSMTASAPAKQYMINRINNTMISQGSSGFNIFSGTWNEITNTTKDVFNWLGSL